MEIKLHLIDELTELLNMSSSSRYPIINETNYKGKINCLYPQSMRDALTMKTFVNSLGLNMREVEREMKVLVLTIL